ncbi:HD domain-containing protein [Streptomyces albidoflavus]|uniref:HD domain-containing protein n=2 Tax=Streptomyces TaxID=1883 RepID=A0AB37XES5_9ACTN|nr:MULTISPECIES: HD domain-containing protein [Streptomyces]MYQ73867.1 HD domain-containing protein [Streptomyces sp. SID4934]MYW61436.1 HD domain-containing protein [Streptomyces sp. SID8370]MYW88706.1 HD domain-containing protein [Streptomyces sp. SID8371]MYX48420.1 HD domain-containing protein [Streptomyces sp. SID8385]NUW08455.1 HD domain-containing protein [Streptomyces sp. CAI-21]QLA57898.1 HD domain-containing protein [Streptomyces violascens]
MAGYENAEPEVAGVRVPDTRLAAEATELVRETAPELIYHHSRRVYYFGALRGKRRGLSYDPELLYLGAMFHDLGLGEEYRNSGRRFEVDSADEARRFLAARAVPEDSIRRVWTAIALHTTPGIPEFMEPEVALVTAGVEYDVLGLGYDSLDEADRTAIVARHPRPDFKRRILAAFTEGVAPKPETTFGNVKADVLAHFVPGFTPGDFVTTIEESAWPE